MEKKIKWACTHISFSCIYYLLPFFPSFQCLFDKFIEQEIKDEKFLKYLPALFMFYGSSRHAFLIITMKKVSEEKKLVRKNVCAVNGYQLINVRFSLFLFHKSTLKTNINGWKEAHKSNDSIKKYVCVCHSFIRSPYLLCLLIEIAIKCYDNIK